MSREYRDDTCVHGSYRFTCDLCNDYEKPNTIRMTKVDLTKESTEIVDLICDLMPGRTRMGFALAMISLSRQVEKLSPSTWAKARKLLDDNPEQQ